MDDIVITGNSVPMCGHCLRVCALLAVRTGVGSVHVCAGVHDACSARNGEQCVPLCAGGRIVDNGAQCSRVFA